MKEKKEFKVPIVVIGASVLGVAIINQLIDQHNHVVVIDKEHTDTPPLNNAMLRNQHTLQSGILQILEEQIREDIDEDKLEEIYKSYLNIANSYKDIMYDDTNANIISKEQSFIHIETDLYEKEKESIIDRYIHYTELLAYDSKYQTILQDDKLDDAIDKIGKLYKKPNTKQYIFELPDKAIDYDKLLKIKKNRILTYSKDQKKGKAYFIPKSKKIELIKNEDGSYNIDTDKALFKTKYVILATGSGANEVLSKVVKDGDGSSSRGYVLLKTKSGSTQDMNLSIYVKRFEKPPNKGNRVKSIFVAKHGNEGVHDTSFLIFGNGKGRKITDCKKSKKSIEKLEEALKNNISDFFGIALKDLAKDTDKFSCCILRYGKKPYHPHIFHKEDNPNLISAHPGLTSTAKPVAQDILKNLGLKSEEIGEDDRRLLYDFCGGEHDRIQKSGTLMATNRDLNSTTSKPEALDPESAWFRSKNL